MAAGTGKEEDSVKPEHRRREVFVALLQTQDIGLTLPEVHENIARIFAISERDVRAIEQEGFAKGWQPSVPVEEC